MTSINWRYSPAFRLRGLEPGGVFGAPVVTRSFVPTGNQDLDPWSDGALTAGSHLYEIFRSIDGAGRFMSSGLAFPAYLIPGGQTGSLHFDLEQGGSPVDRWVYWIWKFKTGWPGFRLIGWSDRETWVDWQAEDPFAALNIERPFVGASPFQTGLNASIVIPIAKEQLSFVGSAPLVPRSPQFNHAKVKDLVYEALTDDSEREDLNKQIRRRERGVRARVDLKLEVKAGTQEESDLHAIYAARLAWPNATVEFTLNYDAANPDWKQVQIVGDLPKVGKDGRRQFVEADWTIVPLEPNDSAPWPVVTDGRGFWA